MSAVEMIKPSRGGTGRAGFRRDRNGTVAIEFAVLAPLMIVLMVGVVDLGSFLMKYRHAVQAASSLAQTGAYLSIQDRDPSKGTRNTITKDQVKLLGNGLKMVLGETDAAKAKVLARRVVRTGTTLVTDWTYGHGLPDDDKKGAVFPLDTQKIISQIAPGESLMVVDVSFTHQFLFTRFFGKDSKFSMQYTAGVPSY